MDTLLFIISYIAYSAACGVLVALIFRRFTR